MSAYLEVKCNYDCGALIIVELDDRPRGHEGRTPKFAIYEWIGQRVMDALRSHHEQCVEYAKANHPRPALRVVEAGS